MLTQQGIDTRADYTQGEFDYTQGEFDYTQGEFDYVTSPSTAERANALQ